MANQEFSHFDLKEKEAYPTYVSLNIPAKSDRIGRPVLHRVPPHVRKRKKHIYEPVVVSLGPYHHGQPRLIEVETFKYEVLHIKLGSCPTRAKNKGYLFLGKILERIGDVRSFYGGLSTKEYDDTTLAEMMLRDACFVSYIMESQTENGNKKRVHTVNRLGMFRVGSIINDLFVLENQIPLWVLKLFINLTYDDDDDDNNDHSDVLLYEFLSFIKFGDHRLTRVRWEDGEKESLHILDAFRTSILKDLSFTSAEPVKTRRNCSILGSRWSRRKTCKSSSYFEQIQSPFGSVTELITKGIRFDVSSYSAKDITFDSYLFYGKLHLPLCIISDSTEVVLSNFIAFEMSPESNTDFALASYAGFMKSLIQNAEDVKVLRERSILFSTLSNDEEVVKIFKGIHGYDFYNSFHEVRMRIKEHCSSKVKTWVAELVHTYFRSPWSTIALFAAAILLGLTALQTYYTIISTTCRRNN